MANISVTLADTDWQVLQMAKIGHADIVKQMNARIAQSLKGFLSKNKVRLQDYMTDPERGNVKTYSVYSMTDIAIVVKCLSLGLMRTSATKKAGKISRRKARIVATAGSHVLMALNASVTVPPTKRVEFNKIIDEIHNPWKTSKGRFKAPITGNYSLSWSFGNLGSSIGLFVASGGTDKQIPIDMIDGRSVTVACSKGDFISFKNVSSKALAINVTDKIYASITSYLGNA